MQDILVLDKEVYDIRLKKNKKVGRPPKNPKEIDEEISPSELEEIIKIRGEIAREVFLEMLLEMCPSCRNKLEVNEDRDKSVSDVLRLLADKLEDV